LTPGCAAADVAAAAAALAAIGSPNAGATSDRLAALLQWQRTIEAAEAQWGPLHPAVGRAWLELARALQAVDKDSERAKLATKKAFDICQILLKETATVSYWHAVSTAGRCKLIGLCQRDVRSVLDDAAYNGMRQAWLQSSVRLLWFCHGQFNR
jgi:hypothetical protein